MKRIRRKLRWIKVKHDVLMGRYHSGSPFGRSTELDSPPSVLLNNVIALMLCYALDE